MKSLVLVCAAICLVGCGTPQSQPNAETQSATKLNLIDQQLKDAQQKGMEIVHNVTLIPCGKYAPAAVTIGSDKREFDGVAYFNDLANPLKIGFSEKGQEYQGGRGIALWQNKVYCLGF